MAEGSEVKVVPKPQMSMEFLTGDDGYYVKKRNPLFEAVVRTGKNPEAPEIKESLTYHARKIPGPRFRSWLAFFRDVAKENHGSSEGGLMLLYQPVTKEWQAFPPKQNLNSAHVDFGAVTETLLKFRERFGKEWILAGTAHSHPGEAFASSTDEDDEKKMDGVHIIVPDFGRRDTGFVAHVCASTSRFVVKKIEMLIDIKAEGCEEYPKEEWLKQIKFGNGERYHRGTEYVGLGGYGEYGRYGNYYGYGGSWVARDYTLDVEGKKINLVSKKYESLDVKHALKLLGFEKNERAFIMKTFTEDVTEMTIVFDYLRDAVKYVATVRGSLVESEKDDLVEKCKLALGAVFDLMKGFSERRIKDGPVPEADLADDPEEEEEESDNEVKSTPGPTEETRESSPPAFE